MKTKVIAMYLPQYHRIRENDLWWGEGYTDWEAVKNSKPLYVGHQQPKIPYEKNYYDLSEYETLKWQIELAAKYGIYGFGIYHYWFSSGQVLLDKPAYIIKDNSVLNLHYFFMWDNGNWKRTWSNVKFSNSWAPLYDIDDKGKGVLAELKYGDEDEWKKHFDYLLPFFKDDRYIKIEGKPLFGIFNQNNNADLLNKMFKYWNKCAIKEGFSGVAILGKSNVEKIKVADYEFDYEPATHGWVGKSNVQKILLRTKDEIRVKMGLLKKYDYKKVWKKIINDVNDNPDFFSGAFVRFDDTPRRGNKGTIIVGESPEIFKKEMIGILDKSKRYGKSYLFLTAWNEWGEGAYLEPDEQDKFAYLEALKEAIETVG